MGPFLRGWILNTQYILGILLRTDRSIKRGWWIFFLNQPKHMLSQSILLIFQWMTDCTKCVKQIIICHDYARLSMWEISPIIQCWIDINITIKSDLRLELTQLRVVTTAHCGTGLTNVLSRHNHERHQGRHCIYNSHLGDPSLQNIIMRRLGFLSGFQLSPPLK